MLNSERSERDSASVIGKVELIEQESIAIKSFDGITKWDKESEIIKFDSNNTLQIEASHIRGFKRSFARDP